MEEKMLTMKQESEIKEKAQKIKEEKKLRKIYKDTLKISPWYGLSAPKPLFSCKHLGNML